MFEKLEKLEADARVCRLLAETSVTEEGRSVLVELAENYAAQARTLLTAGRGPRVSNSPWWYR